MTSSEHIFSAGPRVSGLLSQTAQIWQASLDHRFIKELFAGTLDREVLAHYLVQDYQFFDAFLSMLGACVARADSMQAKLRFSEQLGFLASQEDSYFVRAFKELGVEQETYQSPALDQTTRDFQDLMYSASDAGSYAELLVMLLIAEGLYLDWGSMQHELPSEYIYLGWIDLHRGADFEAWVQFLADELENQMAQGVQAECLLPRWKKALDLEYDFFELGYRAVK